MARAPLESLDDFLTSPAGDRRLTRAVRRHLHDFKSLLLVGPAEASYAAALRLLETFPLSNVHLVAVDAVEERRGTKLGDGALEWGPSGPNEANAMLRALLRQDPDVMGALGLAESDLQMMLMAMETGHLVIANLPFPTRAALERAFEMPELAPMLPTVTAVLELDGSGKLAELWLRAEDGAWTAAPAYRAPASTPKPRERFAPRRPPPARTAQQRASFVPRVVKAVPSQHRIGAASVLLPPGDGWPLCRGCQSPLQHVVQLSGAELPPPLRRSSHVHQFFLCEHGCERDGDDAPGITLLSLEPKGLVETSHEEIRAITFGGGISSFFERAEDPHPEDAREERSAEAEDDEERPRPWDCDKVGGWPLWEQGADWPEHGGEQMELLFQLAESGELSPGRPPGWDDEASVEIPGTPDEPQLDPERPVHLPGLLSGGDGRGWLFRSAVDPKVLRFLWQTS